MSIAKSKLEHKSLQIITEQEISETNINGVENRKILLRLFWILASIVMVTGLTTCRTTNLEEITLFGGLIGIALTPLYLWCKGKVYGLPVVPVFALSYVWTYIMPLISNQEILDTYTTSERFFGALTIAGFLSIITYIWYGVVKTSRRLDKPSTLFIVDSNKAEKLFLGILVIAIIFSMSVIGGWTGITGTPVFSLIRGAVLGLTNISGFILGFRHGQRGLSAGGNNLFRFLVILYCMTNAASLLLVGSIIFLIITGIGFTMGRKKIPLITIILVIFIIIPLHYAKGEMRQQAIGKELAIQPWEYPAHYTEWISKNFENKPLTHSYKKDDEFSDLVGIYGVEAPDNKQRISDRASLLQQLLLTQVRSPDIQPFLEGATYQWIPQLLIPRIFLESKVTAHYATSILNIYYGKQRLQDTFSTTIGWGLLSEAYANFGLVGCAVLAVILGYIFGNVSAWSHYAPLLSARYLASILLLVYSFNDSVASVFISSLFQSLMSLLIVNFFIMEKKEVK
ncbi:MAG: hypothetical protein ACK456_13885 [Pseudanabaenaceae cyanobacterium]